MSAQALIEIGIGLALLIGAAVIYRRRSGGERQGSQSAVLMMVAAALLLVHGLGLMDARPTAAELEQL